MEVKHTQRVGVRNFSDLKSRQALQCCDDLYDLNDCARLVAVFHDGKLLLFRLVLVLLLLRKFCLDKFCARMSVTNVAVGAVCLNHHTLHRDRTHHIEVLFCLE